MHATFSSSCACRTVVLSGSDIQFKLCLAAGVPDNPESELLWRQSPSRVNLSLSNHRLDQPCITSHQSSSLPSFLLQDRFHRPRWLLGLAATNRAVLEFAKGQRLKRIIPANSKSSLPPLDAHIPRSSKISCLNWRTSLTYPSARSWTMASEARTSSPRHRAA